MFKDELYLIWVDIETTGLNPSEDEILEICCVITDKDLNIKASSKSLVISTNIYHMNDWCMEMHSKNGLIKDVLKSNLKIKDAEAELLKFIQSWSNYKTSPMCGSSVHFDRSFLKVHMPLIEDYFSYRNIDVSSFKEIIYRWYDVSYSKSEDNHRAESDIIQSIKELNFYKNNYFI